MASPTPFARETMMPLTRKDLILVDVAGYEKRQWRCRNCNGTILSCSASGCGQRKELHWRRRK